MAGLEEHALVRGRGRGRGRVRGRVAGLEEHARLLLLGDDRRLRLAHGEHLAHGAAAAAAAHAARGAAHHEDPEADEQQRGGELERLGAPARLGLVGHGQVLARRDGELLLRLLELALEADGGHTTIGDVALDDLTFDSLGKVCVTLVVRPEKAYFGLTDKMHILGTDSNKLGNTTRHFII